MAANISGHTVQYSTVYIYSRWKSQVIQYSTVELDSSSRWLLKSQVIHYSAVQLISFNRWLPTSQVLHYSEVQLYSSRKWLPTSQNIQFSRIQMYISSRWLLSSQVIQFSRVKGVTKKKHCRLKLCNAPNPKCYNLEGWNLTNLVSWPANQVGEVSASYVFMFWI